MFRSLNDRDYVVLIFILRGDPTREYVKGITSRIKPLYTINRLTYFTLRKEKERGGGRGRRNVMIISTF